MSPTLAVTLLIGILLLLAAGCVITAIGRAFDKAEALSEEAAALRLEATKKAAEAWFAHAGIDADSLADWEKELLYGVDPCNCQAIPGTPNYPGPWHPKGDASFYPCARESNSEHLPRDGAHARWPLAGRRSGGDAGEGNRGSQAPTEGPE